MKQSTTQTELYCPRCGRKVAIWDGRSSMNISVNCKKCRKRVVYHVDTGTTELKKILQRTTSSGMTFC